MPFLTDNLRHERHLIDFKRIFLVMSPAKTCRQCPQNGKPLILLAFLFGKRVMSLSYSTLSLIIITSYCLCASARALLARALLLTCHLLLNNATI